MHRRTLHPPERDHLEHQDLGAPAPARSAPRHLLNPRSGWFRTLERKTNLLLSRTVYSKLPGRTVPYSLQVLRHLTVSEGEIRIRGLDRGLDGARILAMTDIHAGPFLAIAALESALARLAVLKPDVILLGGDFATSNLAEVLPHLPALGALEAPLGVFAVMGNHDHYTGEIPRLCGHLEEAGIRVLNNRAALLEREGGRLLVAGIDDYLVGKPDLRGALSSARRLDAEAPIVLLSHNPDVFFEAARGGVSLVVSGHTHGGQVRLPGLGVLVRMSRYRLDEGRYRAAGAEIVVSRGLGVSGLPFRSSCPPEGLLLTLRRERQAVAAVATSDPTDTLAIGARSAG